MSDHKQLSPSKFDRVMLCPGSVREEAKYPDPPSGPAAIDGTHSHTLLETCINDGLRDPEFYLGQTLKDHEGEFKVEKDRVARVHIAVEYISRRKMELGFAPVHAEMKLNSEWAFLRDDMGGTCDVHICGDGVLEVIDYKDGMGAVDLPCVQLDLYTLMILGMYDLTKFHTVRQTIIQPKLEYRGEKGVVWVERPVSELLALIPKYQSAAKASDKPDAPLAPGEKQCKYCKHKGACAALNGQMMAASGIVFQDVSQQAANKDVTTMTDQQLREMVESAPLMRQMLEAAEKEALRRLEAGQVIDGLKVVRGRGSRDWNCDEPKLLEVLKKAGVPLDACYEKKLLSPAKVEKLTWKKRDGSEHMLSDKHRVMLQSEYIKKFDGKLTVVPASDDRPAVILSAAPLFSAVDLIPDFLKGIENV